MAISRTAALRAKKVAKISRADDSADVVSADVVAVKAAVDQKVDSVDVDAEDRDLRADSVDEDHVVMVASRMATLPSQAAKEDRETAVIVVDQDAEDQVDRADSDAAVAVDVAVRAADSDEADHADQRAAVMDAQDVNHVAVMRIKMIYITHIHTHIWYNCKITTTTTFLLQQETVKSAVKLTKHYFPPKITKKMNQSLKIRACEFDTHRKKFFLLICVSLNFKT